MKPFTCSRCKSNWKVFQLFIYLFADYGIPPLKVVELHWGMCKLSRCKLNWSVFWSWTYWLEFWGDPQTNSPGRRLGQASICQSKLVHYFSLSVLFSLILINFHFRFVILATPIFTFMLTRQLIKFNYSNVARRTHQVLIRRQSRSGPRRDQDWWIRIHSMWRASALITGICLHFSAPCVRDGERTRNGQDSDKTRH